MPNGFFEQIPEFVRRGVERITKPLTREELLRPREPAPWIPEPAVKAWKFLFPSPAEMKERYVETGMSEEEAGNKAVNEWLAFTAIGSITPSRSIPKPRIPPSQYGKVLLKEINTLPELPKMQTGVLEWKPPTLSYQNPFSRALYRVWEKANRLWATKAPRVLRTFHSREIEELGREKQRIIDGLTKRYKEDIVNVVKEVSFDERQRIGLMINKYIKIPKEYQPLIKGIDMEIGKLSKGIVDFNKKWIKNKWIKPADTYLSEDTFLAHLGEYARTFYVRPPKVPGRPPMIKPRGTLTRGLLNRSMFKRKLTLEEWGKQALELEGKGIKEISALTKPTLERIGLDAKKAYGWVYEADAMLHKTFKDLVNNYATMQWQDAIVSNPNLYSKIPKEGFVHIKNLLPRGVSKDIRLGPLNDGYINPGLADEIQLMIRQGTDSISAVLAEPLSWWKAFKVAGNPATVARNYLSGGLLQTDMAGYPVWTPRTSKLYVEAVKDYATKSPFYRQLRNAGQYGMDYYAIEIEPTALVSIEKQIVRATNPMETYGARLAGEFGKKTKTMKGWFAYYGHLDHIQRTYLAKCAMKDGANLPQAIHFANKWELDYRIVPQIIDKMRTGPLGFAFPFISFYGLMVPRILEVLVTRPWTMLKYPAIVQAFNYASRMNLKMNESQIEAAKPKWLKDHPYVTLLPYKDNQGNPIFLDLSYTLPFGSWETGFMDWKQVLDMGKGAGLAGILYAVLNNYDSFRGKPIYKEADLSSVKREKVAEYTLRSMGPGAVSHIMNLWAAAKGEYIGYPIPRERDLTQVGLRAIGVSTYTGGYNEAMGKIRHYEKMIRDMNFALEITLRNPNISTKEKIELREGTREEIERIRKEMAEIKKAMPTKPKVPTLPITAPLEAYNPFNVGL